MNPDLPTWRHLMEVHAEAEQDDGDLQQQPGKGACFAPQRMLHREAVGDAADQSNGR